MKSKCAKCNNELIKAYIKGLNGEFGVSKKSSGVFIGLNYSLITPYVCGECGYVECYVEDLNKFKNEK